MRAKNLYELSVHYYPKTCVTYSLVYNASLIGERVSTVDIYELSLIRCI